MAILRKVNDTMRWGLLVVFSLSIFSNASRCMAQRSEPTSLIALDLLAAPYERVLLKARLELDHAFRLSIPLPEEPVSFFLDESLLGAAITDENGEAVLARLAPKQGIYEIRIEYPGIDRFAPAKSRLRLVVRKKKTCRDWPISIRF